MMLLSSSCGKPYTFRDDNFYTMLAKQTDLAFPELTFTSANDLNADTLYLFFHFFMKTNALYAAGHDFQKKNGYEIPVSKIKKVLYDYLGTTNFDPNQLSDKKLYDSKKDIIKIKTLPAFGGSRHVKLKSKKYIGGNKVKFTVSFYDSHQKSLYDKTIVISQKSNENKYQLQSIENSK